MATLFLNYSVRRLDLLLFNLEECLTKLNEGEVWSRQSPNENAIGNITLHMFGNIRQLIIHGVGGTIDARVREREFAALGGCTAEQVLEVFR